jgi:hypothetical protein
VVLAVPCRRSARSALQRDLVARVDDVEPRRDSDPRQNVRRCYEIVRRRKTSYPSGSASCPRAAPAAAPRTAATGPPSMAPITAPNRPVPSALAFFASERPRLLRGARVRPFHSLAVRAMAVALSRLQRIHSSKIVAVIGTALRDRYEVINVPGPAHLPRAVAVEANPLVTDVTFSTASIEDLSFASSLNCLRLSILVSVSGEQQGANGEQDRLPRPPHTYFFGLPEPLFVRSAIR